MSHTHATNVKVETISTIYGQTCIILAYML